jgi:hypothetical protein
MDNKKKFTPDSVRELQEWLGELPAFEATELSKQQAIRALSPQISALRSKGYSWAAIATMLSERGMPVSAAALRTYLRRLHDEAPENKPRTLGKRARGIRPNASLLVAAPSHAPPSEALREITRVQPPAARPSTNVASNAPRPSTSKEPEPRRSAFVVRPDSEKI